MKKAFSCQMCGECCKGRGGIWVTIDEIKAIADFLNMDEKTFIKNYCEMRYGHYYIKEKEENGEMVCIFLVDKSCAIHSCKPLPCRLWPYWRRILSSELDWRIVMEFCPGINREVSFADFVKEGEAYRKKILQGKEDERRHL
ncbi:MAG: YkgJ family cysteine cluster protein [Candidatus Desulfofervidus auxilii]|nr:YkgJ family cysteine cluster protein [Candidatus Desulfofervidus auxilii]